MRLPFSDTIERARLSPHQEYASHRGDDFGYFRFRRKDVALVVIASAGSDEIPWEHVSVSTRNRCPTWDEMAWVKRLFFADEEAVVQYHPPKSQYVNHHPFCLHLWKPIGLELPLPPTLAVGPEGETLPL